MLLKRVLLTGGSGFAGSHAVRHILLHTDWKLVLPIRQGELPYRLAVALRSLGSRRVTTIQANLSTPSGLKALESVGRVDYVLNFASLSNGGAAVDGPAPFIRNNVEVMLTALEYARRNPVEMFLHISTDEVYGPAPSAYAHREWEPINPSNPYSASKAAQEAIGISYWRTYGVPFVIANTMNIIGEMQPHEKLIPVVIRKFLRGEPVPIYGTSDGKVGVRTYLHARSLADACLFLINRGAAAEYKKGADRPDRWNVVGNEEVSNAQMAFLIARIVHEETGTNKQLNLQLVDLASSRPGHDLRFALDGHKLAEAGWIPPMNLEESLRQTIRWNLKNELWMRELLG